MDFSAWRDHFETNATRPMPDLRAAATGLPPALVPLLASTIARLQAGETGEGRIVNQVRQHGLGDAAYRECMRLFVAEEGRHAAILGRAYKALTGHPALDGHPARERDHWTARYFTVGRRLIGPRTKIVVLLAAEVIAVRFYEAMSDALPEGALKDVLAQIRNDEVGHLEFHTDFFVAEASSPARRAAFRAAWWPTASACCAVVLGDHGATLKALGIDRAALFREMLGTIGHIDRRVGGADEPRWTQAGVVAPGASEARGARPAASAGRRAVASPAWT